MKRLIARSRSLALVVALTMIAAMCTASTASAASSASVEARAPAASNTECSFVHSIQTCESTDPTAAYYDSPTGNVTNCTFVFNVTWGDRSGSTTKTITNPSASHHLVGEHTYKGPGVYTITVTVTVTVGTCTATNSVHTFTLVKAHPDGRDYAKCQKVTCTIAIDHQITQDLINTLNGTPKSALLGAMFNWCNAYTYGVLLRSACTILAIAVVADSLYLPKQLGAIDQGHGVYISLSLDYNKIGITPQK